MAGLIDSLIEILNQQTQRYEQIVELVEAKTNIIIKGDVTELNDITKTLEDEVVQIRSLDKKRQEITDDIALVLNKDKETLTLTLLAKGLEEGSQEQERLMTVTAALRQVMDHLKDVNQENMDLIAQSIDYVDYSINVLQSTMYNQQPATYSRDNGEGVTQSEAGLGQQSMFDARQ